MKPLSASMSSQGLQNARPGRLERSKGRHRTWSNGFDSHADGALVLPSLDTTSLNLYVPTTSACICATGDVVSNNSAALFAGFDSKLQR